jgi:hypothetical protein
MKFMQHATPLFGRNNIDNAAVGYADVEGCRYIGIVRHRGLSQ